jgi:hypothetical protein
VSQAEDPLLERRQEAQRRERAEAAQPVAPGVAAEVQRDRPEPRVEYARATEVEGPQPCRSTISQVLAGEDEGIGRGVGVALHAPGRLQQERREALDKARPRDVVALGDAREQGLEFIAGERRHGRMLQHLLIADC